MRFAVCFEWDEHSLAEVQQAFSHDLIPYGNLLEDEACRLLNRFLAPGWHSLDEVADFRRWARSVVGSLAPLAAPATWGPERHPANESFRLVWERTLFGCHCALDVIQDLYWDLVARSDEDVRAGASEAD